ncbi:MAG: nucleotidyltransferase domain-containing protein [Clostridium sp.]|jgi:predicted nucleotidyltransferase|nr:nucleotidyltransferase domain-containing protein [Clostridium sp.]
MRPYETPEIQEKLKIIKESVLQVVPDAEAIYLFGSYAYGEPHKDSDLDICVVVPDDIHKRLLEVSAKIRMNMFDRADFPMDLFIKKQSAFRNRKQRATLDKVIANNGVRIYG